MAALDDQRGPDVTREPDAGGGWEPVRLDHRSLVAYPGPAALFDTAGRRIAANGRAEPMCGAIAQDYTVSLDRLRAMASAPEAAPLIVALPGGGGILEVTALPARDGCLLVLGRDVTLERNLRAALVDSRQRYKDLVEISSDFAWEVGADGRFVFVSPKGALGFPPDQLVGRHPRDFILYDEDGQAAMAFTAIQPVGDAVVWMRTAEGGEACLLASARPLRTDDGGWAGARGICRDVTQERLRDAALVRANNRERLLSYVVRTIRDEIDPGEILRAAADATGRALETSGCQIFRILPDDADFALAAQYGSVGDEHPVLDAFSAEDYVDGDIGDWHVLAAVTRYRQSVNGALCLWRAPDRPGWSDDDRLLITDLANQVGLANEQMANHERILRLSRTDSLTGLFNRRAFFEEIGRRFQRLSHEGRPAALIYCDLDNFKWVNDIHGHQTGDQALLAVRDMLLQHTRPIDLVARLGGDEFAIWLEGAEERIALERCRQLIEAGRGLAHFSGHPDKPLHMSLGVAVHDGRYREDLNDLIARADRAMYEVKRDGKGDWRLAPAPEGGGAA
jgi:diguanylate cyclase (GGDEF)-like protein/PAS domain S-box-containing protein